MCGFVSFRKFIGVLRFLFLCMLDYEFCNDESIFAIKVCSIFIIFDGCDWGEFMRAFFFSLILKIITNFMRIIITLP